MALEFRQQCPAEKLHDADKKCDPGNQEMGVAPMTAA